LKSLQLLVEQQRFPQIFQFHDRAYNNKHKSNRIWYPYITKHFQKHLSLPIFKEINNSAKKKYESSYPKCLDETKLDATLASLSPSPTFEVKLFESISASWDKIAWIWSSLYPRSLNLLCSIISLTNPSKLLNDWFPWAV